MTEFARSIVIGRPVDQVFAFTSNPVNLSRWFVGIEEAGFIEGTTAGEGARVRGAGAILGKRIDTVGTVKGYEANRKWAFQITQPFAQTLYYSYEPEPGGTRLSVRAVIEAGGVFKLAMPVMSGVMQRNLENSLAILKELLEAGGTEAKGQERR